MKIPKWIGLVGVMGAICLLAVVPCRGEGITRVNQIAEAVAAPVVTNVTTTVVTLFSTNDSRSAGRVLLRTVQNVGTKPVLYRINSTNVTPTLFHGALAGSTAARDGLGSILDLSSVPFPVSFYCESGTGVVAVVELTQ